ncbi:MAG: sensor histidine kinase [Leptolyngbya sp. SIO1D8]|nr:sensor histidine kinase [Leptolyngbya sp. SIO1D8]
MLSPSIIRNIRMLEWVSLIIHIIIFLNIKDKGLLSLNTLIYAVFFLMSFYVPKKHSNFQHRMYIYLALILAIVANSIQVATNFLVYIYLGKSCFLLHRKETLIVTILTGFGWVSSELYAIFGAGQNNGDIIFDPAYGLIRNGFPEVFISSLGIYTGTSVFILLFCFTIISEQTSRKKAETLSQQVEELAKALERTRIARDIHDSLGHTLTNLDIQLQLAQRLFQTNSDRALQAINLAQTLSSQCIEDVSYALASIRKFDFDLNQAVDHLVNLLRQNTSIKATVEMASFSLSPQMNHQIYLLLKECLINIQKHAQASKIHLKGQLTLSGIYLEVEDNGVGFVVDQAHSGFGLKGISERVQLLGGELKIDSVVGQGTLIQIDIPL